MAPNYTDPRWQKFRLKIFERDSFTCQSCGATEETLHVHHRSYTRQLAIWEYPQEELTTLCEGCHSDIEWAIKAIRRNTDNPSLASAVRLVLEIATKEGDGGVSAVKSLQRLLARPAEITLSPEELHRQSRVRGLRLSLSHNNGVEAVEVRPAGRATEHWLAVLRFNLPTLTAWLKAGTTKESEHVR